LSLVLKVSVFVIVTVRTSRGNLFHALNCADADTMYLGQLRSEK